MRFLLALLLLTLGLTANMELYPKKSCELYNNLKHTKNRGHVVLKLDRTYEMLKHHKGNYLLKVEGATPVQRWVNDDCLSLRPLRNSPLYGKAKTTTPVVKKRVAPKMYVASTHPTQNLLALSWHNAFCETHRYKKECKRNIGSLLRTKKIEKTFVLHGLWPQPRTQVYCNVSQNEKYADKNRKWHTLKDLGLSASTKSALKAVMPGVGSNLHKHEWIKHGTCYGTSANHYYEDAIGLIDQVNNSALGQLFTQNIGKNVSLRQVQRVADKAFGRGAGSRVELRCKNGLVTELWLHLGSGEPEIGALLLKGQKVHGRCRSGRIDKAGFGR
jgi:ribonuclease T2